MPQQPITLTSADVSRLLADPSEVTRASVAEKIAVQFSSDGLNESERSLATEIVRAMVRDAAVRVREALSHNLKTSSDLPHDVAVALAQDVESVALPMIEFSSVLTEQDLVEIVRASTPEKQVAVARRPTVSSGVAAALIESNNQRAVATLVENEGAELSERALQKVLDVYGDQEQVQGSMVRRSQLPITVAERLVATVSESLREYLVAHHDLPAGVASDLILESREKATVSLLDPDARGGDVLKLVLQLHNTKRLTPLLVLRAACLGDMGFFEAAMSVLARISLVNARTLIYDQGPLGLRSLYTQTKLPENLFPAFRVAVDVARETHYDGGEDDRQRHVRRMIERILTQVEDIGGEENLDYLLKKLTQLAA